MVLPGVGAFDDCIQALEKQALLEAARQFIQSGRPFLGICVGYQALFEKSEEFNSCAAGLGIFQGKVVRFRAEHGLKVPQIGWNQLEVVKPECPLFRGIPSGSYFYFVHSFFPQADGRFHRRHAHDLRGDLRVLGVARQRFRHAVSSGEEPEGGTGVAQELRRAGGLTEEEGRRPV